MTINFLQEIEKRGFISDQTDKENLSKLFAEKAPVKSYIGFDCTAESLHVGSLVQIMILRWLQKSGNKPIVLMGGGTTKVGDPSGKDESRKMLDDEGIKHNMKSIKKIFTQFVEFEDEFDANSNKAFMVNNDDWLGDINYIEFLRDYGKHFSVNRMLTMESVKLRLERESHLSFLEFNYMILQAYDFVELNKNYDCRVQIGGSDQWGNIVNGIELNRRVGGEENFGITTPLLTTASGAKMGKSEKGAVWLNIDMLSAYDYWQFWRNTEDADVIKFLKLFTELDLPEIGKLAVLEGADINKAKIILANEATKLCHGEKAAIEAEKTAQKVFEQGGTGDELPVFEIEKSRLEEGIAAFTALVESGLADSNGAARRLIKGGGAKVNDIKIKSDSQLVSSSDLNPEGAIKLSAGKKRHALLKAG